MKCVCVCVCTCILVADADPPTNLVLRQVGPYAIEINWTPPANLPSSGYLVSITESEYGFSGTLVKEPPYILNTVIGGMYNISVVSQSRHFISDILGPKSITLPFRAQGEEIIKFRICYSYKVFVAVIY